MRWLTDLVFRRFGRYFVAGVLAILPLVITVAVVTWVAGLVARFLGPNALVGTALRRFGLQFVSDSTLAYVVGAALVLGVVFAVGIAAEAGARNLVQRLQDAVLQRIPIVGSVYGTSKQVVGMLDRKGDAQIKGMTAVFCYFGGTTGAGVLALLVSPERFRFDDRDYHIVIVPTAPVPIGGGLLFVPVEMVKPVDTTLEALMSIYVSMGVTAPQFLPGSGEH